MNVAKTYDSSRRYYKTVPKKRKLRKARETIYRKICGDATTVVLHSDIPISTDSVGTDGRTQAITLTNFFRWGALKNEYVYARINAYRLKAVLAENSNVNAGCAIALIPVEPGLQAAPTVAPTDMDGVLTNRGAIQAVKQAVNVGQWCKWPLLGTCEYPTSFLNDTATNTIMAYTWYIKNADASVVYGTMTVELSFTFFYRRGIDTGY